MWMVGTVNVRMDQKNRFRLPTIYRQNFGKSIFITIGFEKSAEIWDTKMYNKMHQIIVNKPSYDAKWRKYKRLFMANAFELSISDMGRVLLPQIIVDYLDNTKDLVLIGVGNHLELWNKNTWNNYNKELQKNKDEFSKILGALNE